MAVWLKRLGILTAAVGTLNALIGLLVLVEPPPPLTRSQVTPFAVAYSIIMIAYVMAFGMWNDKDEGDRRVQGYIAVGLGVLAWIAFLVTIVFKPFGS